MFGFNRKSKERELKRNAAAEFEWGHLGEQGTGQKIADAVDEMMERLVMPWGNNMVDLFTKKVAVKLIFSDDDPAVEAQSNIAEFKRAVDDHLETIRPDVRAKLLAYEQLSGELGALDKYKMLLISRFDSIRQNLTMKAVEVAGCVVDARKEEMGFDVDEGENLANGRRILKETRAMRVSLTEDEKKVLKSCLEALG
jgi:hypothetical protein